MIMYIMSLLRNGNIYWYYTNPSAASRSHTTPTEISVGFMRNTIIMWNMKMGIYHTSPTLITASKPTPTTRPGG